MSFLVAPYLLLVACESSFYTMTFLEDLVTVQAALRKNEQVAIDIRHFEHPKLEDTCVCYKITFLIFGKQLYRLYGRILRDVEDVTAVLDTVAAYEENSRDISQAKFVSDLLSQLQHILVARRKMISLLSILTDRDIIPDFQHLAGEAS